MSCILFHMDLYPSPEATQVQYCKNCIAEKCKVGNAREQTENYDLLSAVMICLGEVPKESKTEKGIEKGMAVLIRTCKTLRVPGLLQ